LLCGIAISMSVYKLPEDKSRNRGKSFPCRLILFRHLQKKATMLYLCLPLVSVLDALRIGDI
jgi:hypothetical protein